MNRSFYARYAWPIMIALGLLCPVILWGASQAFHSSNNNVYQWIPQDFPQSKKYEDFRRRFGTDDFALVSWDDCTLADGRLEDFARRCEESKWFDRVNTGPRLLDTLTAEPFNLSRQEALSRLQGTLVGPDHQTTCALVILSAIGDARRTTVVAELQKIARLCGVDPKTVRLGGDAVINAAVDLESERAISQWIILSWTIALAVAWSCLRNVKLILMIFVVSGYSSVLGTAVIYYTGGTMNLVLVVVPVLIYVLPLSAAVHLSNYYRDAVRESGTAAATIRALAAGWVPCTLSAATTSLGLISLRVSHIVPVRMFGVYSAVGILASLVLLFGLLPAALQTCPPYGRQKPSDSESPSDDWGDRLICRWADWLIRCRRGVVGVCLAALLFFAGGVTLVETTVAPTRFFSRQSRWVKDADWLQEKLGPMVPIEVLISFDRLCPLNFLERIELVHHVERTLQAFDEIGGTFSAATFAPPLDARPTSVGPTAQAALAVLGMGDREAIRRRILNKRLTRYRHRFQQTDYLHAEPQREWWRISARVRAFSDVDHDKFLLNVQDHVDAFLRGRVPPDQGVRAEYTGIVPLVYLSQRELLKGLYKSFCLAFAMIGVVMLLLLRNVTAGLLVMLPNVLPAVVTFGTMGWTGKLVDVGAMMTASVALGIAVDDTLHFLTWFGRGVKQGHTRRQAILEAYRRCAPAMTQTTLIAGLGLLVFALSSFQPVSQFGLLMFILLAAALVGDLVLLPAMLATRLGKHFEPRARAGRNRL